MISRIKNFFKGLLSKNEEEEVQNEEDLVEETRVISGDGEVSVNKEDSVPDKENVMEDKGEKSYCVSGEEYLAIVIFTQIKNGLISSKYKYLNDWITDVISKAEFKPVDLECIKSPLMFNIDNVVEDTDSMLKLKRVWKTRKYISTDKALQEYMTELL